MKTYLESEHRQRIEGWGATVTDWHRNGCSLRFCGRNYSLIRSGDGFFVYCGSNLIWPESARPDAALAHVWRHSRNY